MGISGPYNDRTIAIAVATQKCLQYLAFYRGLAMQVDFGSVVDSDSGEAITDYRIVGGTSDSILHGAEKDCEIVDVVWLGGSVGAVVFARVPEMKQLKIPFQLSDNTAPYIPGYAVAYATSERSYSSFADSIEAATFRAAQALLSKTTSSVNVNNMLIETTESKYKADKYAITGNRLEEFTVLMNTMLRKTKFTHWPSAGRRRIEK